MTDRHPITWYEETRRILEAERSGASARCPLTRSRCLELLDELDAYRTPPHFPAPSTPGEGTPARDVAEAVDSCPGCEAPLWPDNLTSCWNCGQTLIDYGPKFRTPPPGEGTGRPLPEFQMVACADHMLTDHRWRCRACRREVERQFQECCEEMWRLQRTTPAPPASPVPPTPTPCPYIVSGDEGTSYCSLAETCPAPSAPSVDREAIRSLVWEWSNRAARERNRMLMGSLDAADTYEMCADELADLLAAADRSGR